MTPFEEILFNFLNKKALIVLSLPDFIGTDCHYKGSLFRQVITSTISYPNLLPCLTFTHSQNTSYLIDAFNIQYIMNVNIFVIL